MQFKLPGDWKTFNNFFFIRVKLVQLVEIIHLKLDPILFPSLRFTSRIWTLVNKKRVQTLLFNGIIAGELEGNLGKHLESREIFLEKRISRQRERENEGGEKNSRGGGRSWILEGWRIVERPAYGPLDSSSSRNEICKRIACRGYLGRSSAHLCPSTGSHRCIINARAR